MHALEVHKDRVSSAAFSPDGSKVLAAPYDRTARLWKAETGALSRILAGHGKGVNSAAFSSNGSKVLAAPYDKQILKRHEGEVLNAEFSPNGKHIATLCTDARVRFVRVGIKNPKCIRVLDHRYNPDLEGSRFEDAIFDPSMPKERYCAAEKL